MKRNLSTPALLVFLILILSLGSSFSPPQQPTALDIIKKADEKMRGKSSQSEMTMSIVRPSWSRSISMKSWSKGDRFSMIYIMAPAKEQGKVFLKRDDEMWSWVPSINRLIKLPPSMMLQSWMGSDFKNDDLVRQSSIVNDYSHRILRSETLRGEDCWVIELTPKPEAPVVWGKIQSWITKGGFHAVKGLYYDEDGFLVQTENGFDIKSFGNREIVSRMEIVPADEPGNKTELTITAIVFDVAISDDFFSIQNMKTVR
jgi:outer membrane lipoprotein-sorting protein